MVRRVLTGAHSPSVPARAEAVLALVFVPGQGRAFRIRHHESPPFEWEIHFQAPAGEGDLVLALPRGLPWGEGERRVATPATSPAASPTWDEGRYDVEAVNAGGVVVRLEGARTKGRYALRVDAPARRFVLERLDPTAVRPMPERVLPMLAHAAPFPANEDGFAFEIKWDGFRAIAYVEDGRALFRSRNLNNITSNYPELQAVGAALAGRTAVLDGEIVAPDEKGRPSFERMQQRLGVTGAKEAQRRMEQTPVVYIAFDVLYLDGRDTMGLPYEERRAILESLPIEGDHCRVSPARVGDGRGLLALEGFEGVVAKRLGSAYEPGARSRAWIKIKKQRRQELVIAGWTPGRGSRSGRIGALLVGHWDVSPSQARARGKPQRLLYAGSVGTGFSIATLAALEKRMEPLLQKESPFANEVDRKDARFARPVLVGEFEFTEWTSDGKLRHPSFKGLREDKDAADVVREEE